MGRWARRGMCGVVVALLALCLGGTAASGAEGMRVAPLFRGDSLPTPPLQHEPWAAPQTTLPEAFVEATRRLFEQGLADPRGCEYREIEIGVGLVDLTAEPFWLGPLQPSQRAPSCMKTHGWVLPAPEGAAQRFAVCWNGLVYPAWHVGEPADLKEDVQALVKPGEGYTKSWASYGSREARYDYYIGATERDSLAPWNLYPIKVCLLLRLGEGALADKVWQAGTGPASHPYQMPDEPYGWVLMYWVSCLHDRAMNAYQRRDDTMAVLDARALSALGASIPAPPGKLAPSMQQIQRSLKEDIAVAPLLLKEAERRAKEPKRRLVVEVGLDHYPDKAQRIAALIGDLEESYTRVRPPDFGYDPTVYALAMEGDDAVEPLLQCFVSDDRVTRILTGVSGAAYEALTEILRETEFKPSTSPQGDRERRLELAQEIREHWQKVKGLSPAPERWYLALADDNAPPKRWLEAAGEIVKPVAPPPGRPNARLLAGESLRDRKPPSVSELMAKRAEELAAEAVKVPWAAWNASTMACHLADWDAAASGPTLAALTKRWMAEPAESIFDESISGTPRVVKLTLLRIEHGDKGAIKEYAEWLQTVHPPRRSELLALFEPLWQHPDDPAVVEAVSSMFANKESPWVAFVIGSAGFERSLLVTPMLGVRPFREHVLAQLANKDKAGTIIVEHGQVRVRVEGGAEWNLGPHSITPYAPEPSAELMFRICDPYAYGLSRVPGIGEFQLYWPEQRRDEAVTACAKLLRVYGEGFKHSPASGDRGRAFLALPALDHPATEDDVAKGHAIFSLQGEGQARQIKLARRPLAAVWTPGERATDAAIDAHGIPAEKSRGCLVWQAEEVLRDGESEAYYGVVWEHGMGRAPAAEVQFYGWDEWHRASDGLALRVGWRDGEAQQHRYPRLARGAPIVVTLHIANLLGTPQTVPSVYYREDGEAGPALLEGIRVWVARRVRRPPPRLQEDARECYTVPSRWIWEKPQPKRDTHFRATAPGRELGPTEEIKALELDVRDWFDISEPGQYNFGFTLSKAEGGFAEGSSGIDLVVEGDNG